MIIAELFGKIPSRFEDKEDILTSNVFSFFKYSERQLLKKYLSLLGIIVSENDTLNAEFRFWQCYDDGTEPDLIIVCGKYYLLFEAKLYSDFSPETIKIASQISREIKMGKLYAENENKEFVFIAITAEYYKDKIKYSEYENKDFRFIWTNWHAITNFLETHLTSQSQLQFKEYATDLHLLLVKKRLRSYIGIVNLKINGEINHFNSIFYNIKTSKFKGEFSGFVENLKQFETIGKFPKNFQNLYFQNIKPFTIYPSKTIFYSGDKIN